MTLAKRNTQGSSSSSKLAMPEEACGAIHPSAKPARQRRKRTPSPSYSAQEKVQAVLAVWTERARPAEICRQLSINWVTFSQWQERAMEGMIQALESRVNLASGEALSPRLQALLQKRQALPAAASRLASRLEKLQSDPPPTKLMPTSLPAKPPPRETPSTT